MNKFEAEARVLMRLTIEVNHLQVELRLLSERNNLYVISLLTKWFNLDR